MLEWVVAMGLGGGGQSYAIIPSCSTQATQACFEHSNFFQVNALGPRDTQLRALTGALRGKWQGQGVAHLVADRPPAPKIQL